ncbi:MAG: acyl-CoA thioesterase [Flavobacteriales bacterium CG_4_9_14_0_2_um_filter_35_242]|nr:acyl-CoA thioesterase [Zetaproteobacteria bacterium]NDK17774.1 acyl-CoA thioesterase [Flavobacteriales bacterium]OIO10253.1 MAG: acyl-CoA thioesterase [Flavobacteriaceae bacterium CG1_02_35_72]PIR14353.1 MAG: acyl-CoA thioesterase [Flavobacteriales bacterium CG11_big_fil_rev_8_21_14_0_20_35_7]PIV16762.1 MAG: acyl-CoA thioesterase [Flavobacteriales bacterium CG03_land_8_20_14_0_80_35_15]PIX07019.1 MAG: acyl-CoA thioesterase [Flavobacteriales bacterium CG_4_8_14_3_um_filter_35_10]PJA05937.1 
MNNPQPISIQQPCTEMTILVTPEMANFSGRMHGGELLKMLDKVAYTCASRYCGEYVVTISVDKVTFKQPIFMGELLTFLASVNYTGKSSLEVGIKVIAEDIKKRTVRHSNTSYFTMVAIDENGKKFEVPQLELITEVQKERFHQAENRRLKRLTKD